jgi:hypothetical protein
MTGRGIEALTLTLHGVTLSLETDDAAFAAYVSAAMRPYLYPSGAGGSKIVAELEIIDAARPSGLQQAFPEAGWSRRPDRDLYMDGNTAYWLRIDDFLDLQLRVAYEGGRLVLAGRYYFSIGSGGGLEWLRRLRHRGRLDALRAHRFSTLLYYMVYYPILWWLGRFEGWGQLHAGAVVSEAGAVLAAGMPGCGKSTLTVAMSCRQGWEMMSDNLVLFNDRSLLACPELLLLDPASIERIGAAASALEATGETRVFGRDAYRPARVHLDPAPLRAVLVVGRGKATEIIRIDEAECVRRILAGNLMAKELRRSAIMAGVMDLVAATAAECPQRRLERLVAGLPCFALWVGPDDDPASVVRTTVAPALETRRVRQAGTE